MTDLADTFGEDFAEGYEKKVRQKQQARNRLSEEGRKRVADMAVNQQQFHEGDPMFDFTDESGVTHRVMLMEFPDMNDGSIYRYAKELSSGAVSIPFDYLGDWVSCLFNPVTAEDHGYDPDIDGLKSFLASLEEGGHYVLAGNHDIWTDNSGEDHDQLEPVTCIMDLNTLKQLANSEMDEQGFDSDSESGSNVPDEFGDGPQPDQGSSWEQSSSMQDESSEDLDEEPVEMGETVDGDSSEDEAVIERDTEPEEPSDDGSDSIFDEGEDGESAPETSDRFAGIDPVDITDEVDNLGNQDERVWELEEGMDATQKLVNVVSNRTGIEDEDAIRDISLTYIQDGDDGVRELITADASADGGEQQEEEEEEDTADEDLLF